MRSSPKRGQVVAVEHGAEVAADERAGRRAASQDLLQHPKVDARTLPEQQRLRCRDRLAELEQIHQQFGGVPGAVPADVHDPHRVAESFQQSAVPFHRVRLTPDEQLQLSLSRGLDPPASGRLKYLHSPPDGLLTDGPDGGWRVAGHVDPGRSRDQFFEGTARAKHHCAHLDRTWQHSDQHTRCRWA